MDNKNYEMEKNDYQMEPEKKILYQGTSDTDKIVMVLLILLLPPLAVWYKTKQCDGAVCLNILLMFLFVIPACIHAVYVCLIKPDEPY